MRAIAIMNNKGGVGKTVTAINLADILVRDHRKRVVPVDCDGQANMTKFFLPVFDPDVAMTTADILTGNGESVWSDNLMPVTADMEMLPASDGLYDLDMSAIKDGCSAPENLGHFVQAAKDDGDVDFILFDCPPGYTVSSVAALLAADEVVIPVTMDKFSIDGVSAVLKQTRRLQRAKPGLKVTALLTQAKNSDAATEGEKLLRNLGVSVFQTRIRQTEKVPEHTMCMTPLVQYSPRSLAAMDYRRWVRELLEV